MRTEGYDRTAAYEYARKWARSRNPRFYDFGGIGGDCTNFVSQCIYAGAGIMNYTPVLGWYYISPDNRTASWTGVKYLYNFLINNDGFGPFGKDAPISELKIGDVIQLGRSADEFYHTALVVGFTREGPLVAAHSYDAFEKPLYAYSFERAPTANLI